MKNIDSLIGKACVEYCEQVGSVYNEKDVFKAGSHFALSLFKWRKVSEELPKVEDKTYQIITRVVDIPTSCTIWNIRDQRDCDTIARMNSSEWMPIPQID